MPSEDVRVDDTRGLTSTFHKSHTWRRLIALRNSRPPTIPFTVTRSFETIR